MKRFSPRAAITVLSGCLALVGLAMLVRAPATVREVLADVAESVVGVASARAEQAKSRRARMTDPSGTVSDPYIYYPGTEPLAKTEIRVIACGTGMPAARRGQGAACFVVELGNGDKFVFDMGSGSMRNIMALNIPADFLDKIFLSHLHTDHWGDLDGLCHRTGHNPVRLDQDQRSVQPRALG